MKSFHSKSLRVVNAKINHEQVSKLAVRVSVMREQKLKLERTRQEPVYNRA